MKRKRMLIDECYTCKKVENCEKLKKLIAGLEGTKRSFRRKSQILVEECEDKDPIEEEEEIKSIWLR